MANTKRRQKTVNLMDIPMKKKRSTAEVQAFTIKTTRKGRVRTAKIGALPKVADEPIADTPKARHEDTEWTDVYDDINNVPGNRGLYNTKSKGRGTLHVKIVSWLPYRQIFLDEILALEACPSDKGKHQCVGCLDEGDGCVYRCLDCLMSPMCCRKCVLQNHRALPFHRIHRWNGDFFDKSSLRELGLRVQLGHSGGPCSNAISGPNSFQVMHINGFHDVAFDFCDCGNGGPRYTQLLRARLFPASQDRPQTAYTFDILDTFQELSLQGKTNAYDFFVAFLFKTNKSLSPSSHKYKDFARAVRLWRHLLMLKRAGRGHDPLGVTNTIRGQLAVECPACPHPGRNLPSDWQDAPKEQRWLYTQFFAVDANFKLKLKDRGLKDIELAPGWAYFVEEDSYQKVVKSIADDTETNTCRSQHNAILAADIHNNREYKASGTGAVVCGRHSLLRKCGVGDLQKGERYANMDYIVLSTENCRPRDLIISYDIACQWSKNFTARILRYPQHLQFDLSRVNLRVAVPKFHLPAHGPQCQTRYSLNFLPNVGHTFGEGVESEWAHINGTATSTREMAPRVRHEALNDHWGAWNWRKILGFGDYFLKKLDEAVEWRMKHQDNLDAATATVSSEAVIKWSSMINLWNENPNADDPYAEPLYETSLNNVRKQFADEDAEEAMKNITGLFPVSARSFISMGLELEERQRAFRSNGLKNFRTSLLAANVLNMRTNLFKQITQWRQAQELHMPKAAAHIREEIEPEVEQVEDLRLLLPSDDLELAPCELRSLECRLRKAQAEDALATIRRLRRAITGVLAFKRKNVNGMGNRPNTRMKSLLDKFQSKITLAKLHYRKAREALIALEPAGNWSSILNVLNDEDISGPNHEDDDEDPKKKKKKNGIMGEGRYQPSWIWLTPGANVASDGSDVVEFGDSIRVEWAKSKARVERWDEEQRLLCEEMRRILHFLKWKSDWWKDQRGMRPGASEVLSRGLDAYASKQSAVFINLALRFLTQWTPRLLKLKEPPSWISDIYALLNQDAKDVEYVNQGQDTCGIEDDEIEGNKLDEEDEDEIRSNAVKDPIADDIDMYNEDDLLATHTYEESFTE